MREEAVLFGKTRSLVGILTDPPEVERSHNLPAIILLNAGIVHRVGPNRLYVKLARTLAAMGFVVLRFDLSGIGDSKVRDDNLPFEKSAVSETQEAMNCLRGLKGTERFVLIGICSGAWMSFRIACCDPRIVGAVLINAPGHQYGTSDELNRALARHYWRIALFSSFSSKNWLKVIKVKFDYWNIMRVMGFQLRNLFAGRRKVPSGALSIAADLRSLAERGVRLLIIHSEGDEGLDYLQVFLGEEIRELSSSGKLRLEIIQGANHTFTLLWSQEHLLKVVQNWSHAMVED